MSGSRYLENELTVLAADDVEGRAALERKMLKAAAVALKVRLASYAISMRI